MLRGYKFLLMICLFLGQVYCAQNVSNTTTCESEQPEDQTNKVKKSTKKNSSTGPSTAVIMGGVGIGVPTLSLLIWSLWPKKTTGTKAGIGTGTGTGSKTGGGGGRVNPGTTGVGGVGDVKFKEAFKELITCKINIFNIEAAWKKYDVGTRNSLLSYSAPLSDFSSKISGIKDNPNIQILHYVSCFDQNCALFFVANGANINGQCKCVNVKNLGDYKINGLTPMDVLNSNKKESLNSPADYVSYLKTIHILALLGGCNASFGTPSGYRNTETGHIAQVRIEDELQSLIDQNRLCHFLSYRRTSSSVDEPELEKLLKKDFDTTCTADIYSLLWAEMAAGSGGTAVHYLFTLSDNNDVYLQNKIQSFTKYIKDFIKAKFEKFYEEKIEQTCKMIAKVYLNIKDKDGHRPLRYAMAKKLPLTTKWLQENGAEDDDAVISVLSLMHD